MKGFLIVDDPDEAAILSSVIERTGCSVAIFDNIDKAKTEWMSNPGDLVLIAARNEGISELVQKFRQIALAPLVILMDILPEELHVSLLDLGADIVLVRPYSSRLLIRQIETIFRRSDSVPLASLPIYQFGDVIITPDTRTIQIGADSICKLSQLEFSLLHVLISNRGRPLPSEFLADHVWRAVGGIGDSSLVRGLGTVIK